MQEEIVKLLPRLRRFAFGLTTNIEDADDLVQSACVRALSNLDSWKPGTRLDSWLFRIVQNLFFDHLRKQAVRGDPVDPEVTGSIPDLKAHLRNDISDRLTEVAAVLKQIPPEQREVLMLVTVSGYSYQEASEQLDLPVGTVMSRLSRAKRRIHELTEGPGGPRRHFEEGA